MAKKGFRLTRPGVGSPSKRGEIYPNHAIRCCIPKKREYSSGYVSTIEFIQSISAAVGAGHIISRGSALFRPNKLS